MVGGEYEMDRYLDWYYSDDKIDELQYFIDNYQGYNIGMVREAEQELDKLIKEKYERAIDIFKDIAREYDDGEVITDALKTLVKSGELSDNEYDYINAEWDNILSEMEA